MEDLGRTHCDTWNLLLSQNYRAETNLAKCEQLESPGGGRTGGFILKTRADPTATPQGTATGPDGPHALGLTLDRPGGRLPVPRMPSSWLCSIPACEGRSSWKDIGIRIKELDSTPALSPPEQVAQSPCVSVSSSALGTGLMDLTGAPVGSSALILVTAYV